MSASPSSRRWAIPLNIHLSVLILLLLVGTAVPLLWLSYDRGRDVAVTAAVQRMQLLTERTVDRYRIVFDNVEPLVTMAAVSESFATAPPASLERKRLTFVEALKSSAYIDGLYAGYPDGSFLHAVNLADNAAWRSAVSAPDAARFAVRIIAKNSDGQLTSHWEFMGEGERVLSATDPVKSNYDPRRRPWYEMASTVPGIVAIGPYVTATTRSLALTVAQAHRDDGRIVIGADIQLATIAKFLATEKVSPRSTAYVLDGFGELIIHSSPAVMDRLLGGSPDLVGEPIHDRLFDAARAAAADSPDHASGYLRFDLEGDQYIGSATTMRVSPALEGNMLVVAAPLADFTGESQTLLRQGLQYSGLLLLFGIAATLLVAKLITRSLKVLTGAAARLGDMDFTQPRIVHSRISEINGLAKGLGLAKEAIRSFALYVPRELVRKIVATSAAVTGGAARAEVTVLFTDIRDFTTICEKTTPEEVVGMLSAYFEALNRAVEDNRGSILQFLGDSICAMWNAPVVDPDHATHACAAALDIAATVERFNALQRAAGRPELWTRVGVHTGPAVVGNVGAASRLQYTAMGDTVNVASRLEGINKEFGTTIIVSSAVEARCRGAFVFRPLGSKQAKGRIEEIEIFELVAAHQGSWQGHSGGESQKSGEAAEDRHAILEATAAGG